MLAARVEHTAAGTHAAWFGTGLFNTPFRRGKMPTGAAVAGGRGGGQGGPVPEELDARRFGLRASKVSRFSFRGISSGKEVRHARYPFAWFGCVRPQQGGVGVVPEQVDGNVRQALFLGVRGTYCVGIRP